MKLSKSVLSFGFLTWLIPFIAAFIIFPLRISNRAFFESIMSVVLVAGVATFTIFYFKKIQTNFLKEGVSIGIIWLVINLAIDSLMFSSGPMKMSLKDYTEDIGFTYLVIPIIAIGIGYLLEIKSGQNKIN